MKLEAGVSLRRQGSKALTALRASSDFLTRKTDEECKLPLWQLVSTQLTQQSPTDTTVSREQLTQRFHARQNRFVSSWFHGETTIDQASPGHT